MIATSRYSDPALNQLRAPARDATDLAQVLGDPAIGGFAVTSVPDGTGPQIRLAISDFFDDRGTDDLLVVYLSCHGLVDARRRLYFAAADTRKARLAATGIESRWLLDQLDDCRSRRQVVILDCCFSGAFALGGKGETTLDLRDHLLGQGRGRVVLTASRATEYSFEGQPVPGTRPTGSVFTSALVTGMRTGAADADADGYVSVDEAYDFAYERVRAGGSAQTPQRWLYGAEGKLLLARSPAGRLVAPAPLPEDILVGLDSRYPDIRAGAVAALGQWLTDPNPARAITARQHLQHVTETDIPRVAATARALLGSAEPATVDTALPATVDAGPPAAPAGGPALARPARRRSLAKHGSPGRTRLVAAVAVLLVALSGDAGPLLPTVPRLIRTLDHARARLRAVAFSPNGRILASSADDGTVRLWNPTTGRPIGGPLGNASAVTSLAFGPSGTLLATGGGSDTQGTVRLWNPATGRTIGPPQTLQSARIRSVAFSPDGGILASAADDGTVQLSDSAARPTGHRLTGHSAIIGGVAFSPGSRTLATGDGDLVRLWDVASGRSIGSPLPGHIGDVTSIAFSAGGAVLASGGVDRTVRLWNPETRLPIGQPLSGHTAAVTSVAFSPDGTTLASASIDHTVRLWDIATRRPIGQPLAHAADVTSVAFSPDGTILATAAADGIVRLWDVARLGR